MQFPIGFTFDYYGSAYTNVEISSNGFLSVNAAGDNGCCTGDPLPDTGTPNGTIAGWWEDLDPGEAGAELYYQTMGTAPNQYLLISVINVQHYPSRQPGHHAVQALRERRRSRSTTRTAPSDGGTHSAGIENQDGTVGVQYYLGTAALATPAGGALHAGPGARGDGHRHRPR